MTKTKCRFVGRTCRRLTHGSTPCGRNLPRSYRLQVCGGERDTDVFCVRCVRIALVSSRRVRGGNTRISGNVIRILEENQYVNSTIFSWKRLGCKRCLALGNLRVKLYYITTISWNEYKKRLYLNQTFEKQYK